MRFHNQFQEDYVMRAFTTFMAEHAFVLMYISFVLVTMHVARIYLHSGATHGAVVLQAGLAMACQVFLGILLGVNVANWLGCHGIHHDKADTKADIHPPGILGYFNVFVATPWYHQSAVSRRSDEVKAAAAGYRPTGFDRLMARLIIPWLGIPLNSFGLLGVATFAFAGHCFGHFWKGVLLWLLVAVTCNLLFGLVNSWGHSSKTMHPKAGRSKDLPWFMFLVLGGEYKHHQHHLYPGKYCHGPLDTGGQIIRLLIWVGLAKPGVRPTPTVAA